MKYRNMAKHYVFETVRNHMEVDPERAADFRDDGSQEPLTEAQLKKFIDALNKEVDRMQQRLLDQNIIV